MILDVEADADLRRVALALHALEASDRDWLLERLPVRAALQELLLELSDLAIPPDPELLRNVLNAAVARFTVNPNPTEARSLCRQLEREPAALRQLLVASLPVDLRAPVLGHWQAEIDAAPSAGCRVSWNPALCALVLECWREAARVGGGERS